MLLHDKIFFHSKFADAEKIAGSASPVESDGAYYQYIADKNTAYRVFYFYYPDGVTSTTMHLKNTVDYEWISKYDGSFYGYFYYTIDLEMRYADEGENFSNTVGYRFTRMIGESVNCPVNWGARYIGVWLTTVLV